MDVVTKTASAVFKASTTLEYADVGDDVAVYRLTKVRTGEEPRPSMLADNVCLDIKEGFTSLKGLQRYAKGQAAFPLESPLRLVPLELLNLVARYGFTGGYERAGESADDSLPFTELVERNASAERIVQVEGGSHMLFDRQGNPLPVALCFEYINGYIDNAHYDLDLALKTLKANDRVFFADSRGEEAGGEILPIEFYNRS